MSAVDVVVPCYNYARFLPQCVSSVLDQDGVDVRVLIIDDCSTDETEQVGRGWAQRDRRVEFRRHPVNRGHIATYNEGLLEWCSAPYSLLLSADDALTPGALARATQLMDSHPEVGMTYGMALVIPDGPSPPVVPDARPKNDLVLTSSRFLEYCCARAANPVPTPTAVVRTELQHRLGGYRPGLPHSGDMEMWMRFASHASVGVVRSIQACYRKHRTNMSHHYSTHTLRDHRQVLEACEDVLGRWGCRFPEAHRWREMLHRRVADKALRVASTALDEGDMDQFRACVEYVSTVDPRYRTSGMWWRLRAKRLIGGPLWQRLRPARDAWQRFTTARSENAHRAAGYAGRLIGTWPD